jgi:uncharacterized membrane protein YqiK
MLQMMLIEIPNLYNKWFIIIIIIITIIIITFLWFFFVSFHCYSNVAAAYIRAESVLWLMSLGSKYLINLI